MAKRKWPARNPAKFDTILIPHCHPDHIFGLMEKETNKPVFPNAELVISDVEYKFWTDPAVIDRLPEARKGLARRIQAVFPAGTKAAQTAAKARGVPAFRSATHPGTPPGPPRAPFAPARTG